MAEIEKTRACQHPFCGCMSNKGYMCLHDGPCQPLDSDGRYFTVSYVEIDGQRLMCKTFTKSPTLNRVTDAMKWNEKARELIARNENVLNRPALIDADTAQAAMGIQGAARKIQGTIFADTEPFDPAKFVSDRVGS